MTKKLVIIFILSITIMLTRSKRSTITINIQFINITKIYILVMLMNWILIVIVDRLLRVNIIVIERIKMMTNFFVIYNQFYFRASVISLCVLRSLELSRGLSTIITSSSPSLSLLLLLFGSVSRWIVVIVRRRARYVWTTNQQTRQLVMFQYEMIP